MLVAFRLFVGIFRCLRDFVPTGVAEESSDWPCTDGDSSAFRIAYYDYTAI